MAKQIQVKLDTTANPPVTLIPEHQGVDRGNDTIEWTPFASQNFTFVSLTFTPTPNPDPFSNLDVEATEVTVDDDNEATGTYPYVVVVNYQGTNYSSAASGRSGTGGSPTINNK